MKKPRKRFTDRFALLVAIDDCQHRIKMCMKLGEGHNREADRLRDEMAKINQDNMNADERTRFHELNRKMKLHREKAEIKIRSLPRRHGDLQRLKDALGQFDTQSFSFMGEDCSVQV